MHTTRVAGVFEDTMGADDGQAGSLLAVHGLLMISVPRARRLKTVEKVVSYYFNFIIYACMYV